MRNFLVIIFSLIGCSGFSWTLQDSIGIEKVDGKTFIMHRVDEKETLYSLSRKYDVPIYKIIEHNPPTEFGLEIGQMIRIPRLPKTETTVSRPIATPVREQKHAEVTTTPSPPLNEPGADTKAEEEKTHVVEEKQTLFSISRLYNVSVADIKQWNKLTGNDLKIGQELIIRVTTGEEAEKTAAPVTVDENIHIVGPSETLYSISRKYDLSLEELKQWNELVTNDITIGQQLTVVDPRGTESRPEEENENSQGAEEMPKPEPVMVEKERESIERSIEAAREYEEKNAPTNFEEVLESGIAEVIEGTDNTRKYLALHRTAKIGTILRVRNDMNDQEVFVRVLGKLPDTGSNQNVLIKLSKAAYNRLGAIDPRFRVTVTYIP